MLTRRLCYYNFTSRGRCLHCSRFQTGGSSTLSKAEALLRVGSFLLPHEFQGLNSSLSGLVADWHLYLLSYLGGSKQNLYYLETVRDFSDEPKPVHP